MARPVDYLSTVTALQQVLQNLELSLDKTRAEEENEWKIRYDIHMRFKRCMEMRTHHSLERIKYLREAMRDGGLEYHADYWLSPEPAVARLVYKLGKERREKRLELDKKEALLDRDAQILKEERNRRRLLQQELESLKLGSLNLPWMPDLNHAGVETTREILKERLDDVVDKVLKSSLDDESDDQSSRDSRQSLPRI